MNMRNIFLVPGLLLILALAHCTVFAGPDPSGSDKGYLGIMIQDFPEQLKELYPDWYRQGVLVQEVIKDSPGYKAGLRKGDIVIAINGELVNAAQDVLRVMSKLKRDDKPSILFIRSARPVLTSPPLKETNVSAPGNEKTVPFEPVPFE